MIKAAFISTAVVAAFIADAAFAADLAPQPVEPDPVAYAPFDWSGPYLGLHAGYGWGRNDTHFSENGPTFPNSENGPAPAPAPLPFARSVIGGAGASDHYDMDGFVGGFHAGYNYQINQFVIGVEGDIDYTGLKGSGTYSYFGGGWSGKLEQKSKWQGSARLRAGYAIDNILIYGTGGVAFAHGELTNSGNYFGSLYDTDDSNTHVGWTIGAGVEYAFTQNWIGRAEVRYTDFGKETYDVAIPAIDSGWDQTTVTLGLSYKF